VVSRFKFVARRSIRRPKRAVIVFQNMFNSIHADTALRNTADLCNVAVRGHYYERIKSVLDDARKAVCSLDLFLSRRSAFVRQGLNIKNRPVGLVAKTITTPSLLVCIYIGANLIVDGCATGWRAVLNAAVTSRQRFTEFKVQIQSRTIHSGSVALIV
jgi:hypothetical protein